MSIRHSVARCRSTIVTAGAALLCLTPGAGAQERDPRAAPVADKWQYHLLNPTPRPLMRELSTDRPDTTESPYTVDAGHLQVELSFLDYTRDEGGEDFEEVMVLPTNVKVGLLNHVDLQLVVTPFTRQEFEADVGPGDASGFGDTQLRLKINLGPAHG